jgi:hypothetical protein
LDCGRFAAYAKGRDGKRHYLGLFATADDAAHAFNVAAYAEFGEFAFLNAIATPLSELQPRITRPIKTPRRPRKEVVREPRRLSLAEFMDSIEPDEASDAPFDHGFSARLASKHTHENPYRDGSVDASQWYAGWVAAGRSYQNVT